MPEGYIKLYRKILKNPVICKDSDYFSIWIYLLLKATHESYEEVFRGKKITLQKGQLITGRKKISLLFSVTESKVQRILKAFESEHQIEQQTSNKNRLITIINWNQYQITEQQNDEIMNIQRTTKASTLNTYKNDYNKNDNKNNSIPLYVPPAGEKPKSKKDEPKKEKYGEFEKVLLTVDEYQKLCERLGDQVQAYIDRLDGYIASKGVKYKSHYATILNWWRKDGGRGNPPDKKKTSSSFFDLIGEVDDG